MKILHIHTTMCGGGIEAMICGLANEMVNTNDVTVCTLFEPAPDDVFWNRLDPRVNKVTLGKKRIGFSLKTLLQIVNLIRKGNFDAVNMHGFFYYYILAVYLLRRKTNFFYTIHSDASKENASWSKYIFRLKQRAFIKGYVHPITISPTSNQSFYRMYGISGRMIENGISRPQLVGYSRLIDDARITSSTKVFVHPGRITEAKNQVVLCRVFSTLVKEGRDVALIIAGSLQDELIFDTIKPYFSERIRFVGERNDIPELLSQCDGMCLPSVWEGLPITLLEALSVGCIPICSPVGGIIDVIHNGENGILSKSSSYEDYLETMKTYLSLPIDVIEIMKEKAQLSFARFEISITSSHYLEYYNEYQ